MTSDFGFDRLFNRSADPTRESDTTPPAPKARRYAGTTFRSTLEADWAATFSSLGIRWEYEPRAVDLASGAVYIPDFYLPEIGAWFEVKGDGVPGVDKAREFARQVVCRCGHDCFCDWIGGELVLVGETPYQPAGQRLRYGAARWYDALTYNALLGLCTSCMKWCWVRPRHLMSCRHCGAFEFDSSHFESLLNVADQVEFHRADRIAGADN